MRSNNALERTVSQRGRTVHAFALGAQLRQLNLIVMFIGCYEKAYV